MSLYHIDNWVHCLFISHKDMLFLFHETHVKIPIGHPIDHSPIVIPINQCFFISHENIHDESHMDHPIFLFIISWLVHIPKLTREVDDIWLHTWANTMFLQLSFFWKVMCLIPLQMIPLGPPGKERFISPNGLILLLCQSLEWCDVPKFSHMFSNSLQNAWPG
jgi:hypothetical protein